MFIQVFPMIFQILIYSKKSKCNIPSDITQGWACPFVFLSRKSKYDISGDTTQGLACTFVFPFNLVKHNKSVLFVFLQIYR